jgi:hypothetical protein
MNDTTDEASRKSKKKQVLSYVAVGGVLIFFLGVPPAYQGMLGEWPASLAEFFTTHLAPYIVTCVVASVLAVTVAATRFPKFVVPVTIAATVLSLSGPVAAGKVARDAQVRRAVTEEAVLRSSDFLKLQGLKGEDLRMEVRATLRGIFVSMFGEESLVGSKLNPTPDEVARRSAKLNQR